MRIEHYFNIFLRVYFLALIAQLPVIGSDHRHVLLTDLPSEKYMKFRWERNNQDDNGND